MIELVKRLAEAERLIENMIRYGVIVGADYERAIVRVRVSPDLLTDWLPWATARANGSEADWDAPEIGEAVCVIAPGGRSENAFVLPALITVQTQRPNTPDLIYRKHKDGAVESYNRAAHEKLFELPASGRFIVRVGTSQLTVEDGRVMIGAREIVLDADTIKAVSADVTLGEGEAMPVARVGDPVANGRIIEGSSEVTSS